MRKENLVRFGAVSVALAMAAGSFMVGCSDDSSSGGSTPAADSGTPAADSSTPVADSSTPVADSSTPVADSAAPTDAAAPADAARDGSATDAATDAGPAAPTGIIIDVVHASPDTPQVGLCLGGVSGTNVVFPAPFDKVQGPLPRWAGTQITVPTALVGAIAGLPVRVYLVPGYTPGDAGAPTCASVTGTGGSAVLLKEFPAGSFAGGKGYIIAATGCTNAGTATVAKCGANTADGGSGARPLTPYFAEFDRQAVPAANTAAQFVHLAAPTEGLAPLANGVKIAGGLPVVSDAGTSYNWAAYVTGANAVKFADAPTAKFSAPLPNDPNTLALGVFTAAAPASPAGQTPVASIPFGLVAFATTGAQNPTYFKKGTTYTFIALGDAANQGADQFRVIALPNNPVN